jgi:diadenosine tetraphosphate (Ap4A) HIT family hydrolase
MPEFALHRQIEADSIFIIDLQLSQLRLQNQKNVPWLILVPRLREVTDIDQLSTVDSHTLMDEIALASSVLRTLYAPDKLNVANLGNIVPQLHIHVIARFKGDATWPAPVWGKLSPDPYQLQALTEIKAKLISLIETR